MSLQWLFLGVDDVSPSHFQLTLAATKVIAYPIHHAAKFLAAVHHHEVRSDYTVENPRCGAIRLTV
jgi:hypothetical protein